MPLFRRSHSSDDEGGRWVVVGLGNPGRNYAGTRHNAGAMALDVLLGRTSGSLKSHKSGCAIAEVTLEGHRVVLARPMSYMNESGRPVRSLVSWYKSNAQRLIVVHDELDIPFAQVRVKTGGGTAGHNGLGSLVAHLGTKDFLRVRIGVGRPREGRDPVGYVLEGFSAAERKELPDVLERAADAVERILEVGAERAMNEFNTRADR